MNQAWPLGAFWVTYSSVLSGAAFLNELREAVITGQKGSVALSLRHRRVLLQDWLLTSLGVEAATFIFSAILFWISMYVEGLPELRGASSIVMVIAVFTLLSGLMMITCQISDFKLMRAVLREPQAHEAPPAPQGGSEVVGQAALRTEK